MFLLSFYIIKFNHSNITNGLKVDLVYRMLRISNSLAQAPHRRRRQEKGVQVFIFANILIPIKSVQKKRWIKTTQHRSCRFSVTQFYLQILKVFLTNN